MRIIRSAALILSIGIAAFGLTVTSAKAAIFTIPFELDPGDQYRLAFVTSTTRDATSSSIGVYNAFVTAAANSQGALAALGATWRAIGSTSSIDARDNTGTNPDNSTGVPIYLLDGMTKIVDDNSDLWDRSIDTSIDVLENGLPAPFGADVWTGTQGDGTGFDTIRLGDDTAALGGSEHASVFWVVFTGGILSTVENHFYALSSPLTVAVIPLPAALPLYGTGLAVMGFLGWRRKRKAAA